MHPSVQPNSQSETRAETRAETESVCFVCYDTHPPLLRACRCTTLVHPACLQRAARDLPSHAAACPVCTQPYTFDDGAGRTRCVRLTVPTDFFVCYAAIAASFVLTSFLYLSFAADLYPHHSLVTEHVALGLWLGTGSMFGALHVATWIAFGKLCVVRCCVTEAVKTLRLRDDAV